MVRCYNQIIRIGSHYIQPVAMERSGFVYWGDTGTGKSHKAFGLGGEDVYCKDPSTKWWEGYRGQENVVIDEFRGQIGISHILRWLDKYPVRFETKGGSACSNVKRIYFTSNLDPKLWWPELDEITYNAFKRRVTIEHFNKPFGT